MAGNRNHADVTTDTPPDGATETEVETGTRGQGLGPVLWPVAREAGAGRRAHRRGIYSS